MTIIIKLLKSCKITVVLVCEAQPSELSLLKNII